MKSDFPPGSSPPGACNDVAFSRAEVMAEVQRVIDSPEFDASPRNRRFFKMVVESTLEGRRITGREVAIKAFGRPETFDPSKDPIVRIECSKLRKALEMYYLKSGARNPLRIIIEKGRYHAAFYRNGATADHSASSRGCLDAGLAALLCAAMAGWSREAPGAARAWSELQRSFPGFPHHDGAEFHLEALRRQDVALHQCVREGLRRLKESAASGLQLHAAMA